MWRRDSRGSNGLQESQKGVAMGTSPSNSVGPFDVSACISPPREPDEEGTRLRAKTVGTAQYTLSSVAHLGKEGKEQVQTAASLQAGALGDDKLTKLETNIRTQQGAPEAWRLPQGAPLPADLGLPSVDVPTTVPNSRSFEPDAWILRCSVGQVIHFPIGLNS
jgi:hypothetical protein